MRDWSKSASHRQVMYKRSTTYERNLNNSTAPVRKKKQTAVSRRSVFFRGYLIPVPHPCKDLLATETRLDLTVWTHRIERLSLLHLQQQHYIYCRLDGFGIVRPQSILLVITLFYRSLHSIQPLVGYPLFDTSSNGTTKASSSITKRTLRLLARTARIAKSWVEATQR